MEVGRKHLFGLSEDTLLKSTTMTQKQSHMCYASTTEREKNAVFISLKEIWS